MKKHVARALEIFFPEQMLKYRAFSTLIKNRESYLYKSGWMQSLKASKPMDQDGHPIPWMNFPVIKFLEEKLNSDLSLSEYGCGYSTLFYASKVKSVISVEHNENWFNTMRLQVPDNVTLIFKNKDIDGDYCRALSLMQDKCDVIIIDGRDRVNCVKQSISCLTKRGIILLDDSSRERYQDAIKFLMSSGFKSLSLEGLKPTGVKINRTTIFYRDGNCFGL